MNRRKFLKQTGKVTAAAFALDPVKLFLSSIFESVFQSAYAQENADSHFNEAKYVGICLVGGPLRNAWDFIIKPNGDGDPFYHNKNNLLNQSFYMNSIQADSSLPEGFTASYRMIQDPDSKLFLPHLWSGSLPRPNAGSVPMIQLAQNMAVLRGINMGDTHDAGRRLQTSPLGKNSISGLVADRSQAPLPAVGLSSYNLFKSANGLSQTNLTLPNPASSAFTSLIAPSPYSYLHGDEYDKQVESVLNLMKAKAGNQSRLLPTTFIDRINAQKLIAKNLKSLIDQYPAVEQKYEGLILQSYSSAFALSDADGFQMAPRNTPHFKFGSSIESLQVSTMRDLIGATPSISSLAASMAVAEIFLTGLDLSYSFSSSLNLGIKSATGLNLKISDPTTVFDNDSHSAGNMVHLYLNNPYFRAISACLFELISQLKSVNDGSGKTLFDHTVIDLNSEFNRVGGENGYGTNHGGAYSCRTLFSGMIPRFTVAGNIYARGSIYSPGGIAAPVSAFQDQLAGIGNVCSTVAKLLGVQSPTPNSASFLMLDSNQKARLAVEAPRNVT